MSFNAVVYREGHFIDHNMKNRTQVNKWWSEIPMDERDSYHVNILFYGWHGSTRLVAVKPLGLQTFYEIAGAPGSEGKV